MSFAMWAWFAGLVVGTIAGYAAGIFAARCAADSTVIKAQVDRDLANSECSAAQAEVERLEVLLAKSAPFSTGAGSPWERPVVDMSRVAE